MENLTELQKEHLCEIILSGGKVHKNVEDYLKEIGFKGYSHRKSSPKYIKTIIWNIIDEYKLHEQYCIPCYPNSTEFNQEEFDIIVGGLLGDSSCTYQGHAKFPCLSFTHKIEHLEYVNYKYNFLNRRSSGVKIYTKYNTKLKGHKDMAECKILSSPVLVPIYDSFYKDGIKIIPEDLVMRLSPLGIAIWYMDDGTSSNYSYTFCTDCFSIEDIKILQKLLSKYGLDTYIIKSNPGNRIRIRANSIKKFKELIEPYMCDCMKYKLQVYKRNKNKYILTDV